MNEIKNSDFSNRLASVIEAAIDGIITISSKGIVETMNSAAAGIFDFRPDEIIGRNIKVLMPEPYKAEHDEYIRRYVKTKIPRIIGIGREVRGKKKNGDIFPFRLAVSEVILNDRIIFTGIIHDLTEVKNAQKEIQELNHALEAKVNERTLELEKVVNQLLLTNRSYKHELKERKEIERQLRINENELTKSLEKEKELSELKTRFVTTASHEFRTPLTSILSSASLIGKYPLSEQQEKREKHIQRIKSAVRNLTGILNDFLSLSKLEEGKIEISTSEIGLEELCQEVLDQVKGIQKTNQKIIHTITGEHQIKTDEKILKNILFNLISNAIKYSEKDIICRIEKHNDSFSVIVKDQGIGIPKEDQKYLFTRFFRAGNVTNIQGTGLGLNIVRKYVELLGGQISFQSEAEQGTTFTISIPQ